MPRNLWGSFKKSEECSSEKAEEKIIPLQAKRRKLTEIDQKIVSSLQNEPEQKVSLSIKNALVTQTVEVMKQTEMLHTLIDTYSNKSGSSNYLLNPCQMIPEIDFPPENAADFTRDVKYLKPVWYSPEKISKFCKAVPVAYPKLNQEICKAAIRKAICGQLRVAGFTDTASSALVLFTDAIEEFIRNFMEKIHETHRCMDVRLETQRDINIVHLEKAYNLLTNTSLVQVHNYFKHYLIARNRSEINEFKGALSEYDKLMKESQKMQRHEYQETDFVNIFDMASSSAASTNYNAMPSSANNGMIQDLLNSTGTSAGIYGPSVNIFNNDAYTNC